MNLLAHKGYCIPAAILAATLLLSVAMSFSCMAGEQEKALPENAISISFDPANSAMTGTSKITLPPGTPLVLYCGKLEVTGSLLETGSRTPMVLRPTGKNTFVVPESPSEQTVYISWNLTASGMDDNLIGEAGITLAGFWHPVPDRDMTFRLEARLPEGFTAISEGDIVTYCLDRTGNRFLTTEFSQPVRGIHFAAGPYIVKSRTLPDDVTLSAFFFEEDIPLADEYLDKAESYLAMYREMIGPYPYSRFSIVENRLPTGYGMPTFTLLGQAVVRLPFIKDTSLGHEILHSWFGNSVMPDDSGGNWSEGLATYLADHFYAEKEGEGWSHRKDQLLRYDSYVHPDNELTLQDFSSASHSQPMARQVRAVGYDKSSMVFHMLRTKLGDELFFKGLQEFYLRHRHARAGWADIEDSFTTVSGLDLSLFFDQWLTRWDIPKLAVDFVDVTQVAGRSRLSFTIEQKTVQPYSLEVPIVVRTRNGEFRETHEISGQSNKIEIFVDSLPLETAIDPDYDVMRALRNQETPPVWSHFMGADEKTVVLPSAESEQEIYRPLFPLLESLGSDLLTPDELDNDDLDEGAFLFLGRSDHSLALFADPGHPEQGVTVDVRANPLSPGQAAVLVTSADSGQTGMIARKLSHYGKYSYLHFEDGNIVDKSTASSEQGIRISLFTGPEAVRVQDTRTFEDIIEEIQSSRVVYVGEVHTDLGSHVLQLQVVQALYQENPELAIGMEMFPRSSQEALDQYIDGTIETEREFIKKSGYFNVWGFDYRYYRDIIEFARRNSIPLVGLNIEKAIVSSVFREGSTDALDEEQAEALPMERKLDAPGYRQRLASAFSTHEQRQFTPEKMSGFIQAQSIWDESMAEAIVDYLEANPGKRMVIIAGNGHVYKDSAIPPRVARRLDVEQSVLSSIHNQNTGLVPGYKVDYLVYTEIVELEPAPKVGVVLETEPDADYPEKTRLRIVQISPHGKALEGGVREKDIILSLDGQEVRDISDMKIILLDRRPGDRVALRVLRKRLFGADEELELEVELSAPMQMGGAMMPPPHPPK